MGWARPAAPAHPLPGGSPTWAGLWAAAPEVWATRWLASPAGLLGRSSLGLAYDMLAQIDGSF
jgi:hypothetical protein